jgi:hypothetical protein
MKSSIIEDPVSRVRMRFEPEGENLFVDNWIEPGGRLAAHLHPRQEERWWVVEGTVGFSARRRGKVDRSGGRRDRGPAGGRTRPNQRLRPGRPPPMPRDASLRLQEFLEGAPRRLARACSHRPGERGAAGRPLGGRLSSAFRDEVVFVSPPRIVQWILIALLARDA